jgi:hypothetical protein
LKLIIERNQAAKKGMLGGHKGMSFTLSYWLDLTDDEADLVERYKLDYYPLTWTTQQGQRMPDDTISNMRTGRTQTLSDVTTLVQNEEIIKRACDQLPVLLSMVRTFGGSEVIEYPRDGK